MALSGFELTHAESSRLFVFLTDLQVIWQLMVREYTLGDIVINGYGL